MASQTISTGFPAIDGIIGGLHPGNLYVIAGRPGVGKSALAMNIAEHVAFEEGVPVAVFSQKMPCHHFLRRLNRSRGGIVEPAASDSRINENRVGIDAAARMLANMKLFVDDTCGSTVMDIGRRALQLQKDEGIQLVVIDFIQSIRSGQDISQAEEKVHISSRLKSMAQELMLPIVVLCDLPRLTDHKKRPVLSDLFLWADLVSEADVVCLLFRESDSTDGGDEDLATLSIAKQQSGPTGEVLLTYRNGCYRFEDRRPA